MFFYLFQEIERLRAELDLLKKMTVVDGMISDGVDNDDGLNNNTSKDYKVDLRVGLESYGLLSTISLNLDGALVETATIKNGLLKLQSGR